MECGDSLFRFCIEHCHNHLDIERVLRKVGDGGRYRAAIALTQEAWHSRLYHELFLCHHLILHHAKTQVFVVGKGEESPCCHALGEGERECRNAVCPTLYVGEEESCLAKALPYTGGFAERRCFGRRIRRGGGRFLLHIHSWHGGSSHYHHFLACHGAHYPRSLAAYESDICAAIDFPIILDIVVKATVEILIVKVIECQKPVVKGVIARICIECLLEEAVADPVLNRGTQVARVIESP